MAKEQAKRNKYEEFIRNWNDLNLQIENDKQQLEQFQSHLQGVTTAHRNESTKLSSKLGFNRKTLGTLEDDMIRIQKRIKE